MGYIRLWMWREIKKTEGKRERQIERGREGEREKERER